MSDEELRALRRRAEAAPDDASLALALEQALLRAGRVDEVVRRRAARVTCARRWADLAPDRRSPRVRWCDRCGRGVSLVRDLPDLERHLAAGERAGGDEALLEAHLRGVVERHGAAAESGVGCYPVSHGAGPPPSPWCECLAEEEPADGGPFPPLPPPRFHADVQDTGCSGWRRLLALIERAERDGRETLDLRAELGDEAWRGQIVTLPSTIGRLKRVKRLDLHASQLVRLPAELGELTALETFDAYMSYRLHWFPYELTRCPALARSRVSTRALYGNYKYRPPFPDLAVERGPSGTACSVCAGPLTTPRQVWLSLRVATDVLPLLVNACSDACVAALPRSDERHVQGPHRGGASVEQPPR